MKRKSLTLAVLATGACFLEIFFPHRVQAQPPACTLQTLQSVYGLQATGTIISEPLPPGPFGKVGWVTFDGNGNFSGDDTVSFNGTIISRVFSENYTAEGVTRGLKSRK
ncbi:hypothetical protein BZZ01_05550 [Nostocales cyanobacterium HT-58-2]|nr:hypothetical protein BZZ01_05550 [Nostocales cyanobacterium HT-58-2]